MPNWKTYESSVRLLSAIVAAHPTLKLNYDEIAKYYPEATASALDHRFRPIKKEALALRAAYEQGGAAAVADKFGDENGTPTKKRATPKKKKAAANEGIAEDNDGSDEDMKDFTPSKKASLNKVKGGRVTKNGRGGKNSAIHSATESFESAFVKEENAFNGYENGVSQESWNDNEDEQEHYFPASDHGNGYGAEDYEA